MTKETKKVIRSAFFIGFLFLDRSSQVYISIKKAGRNLLKVYR
jgi:hypothetical protein